MAKKRFYAVRVGRNPGIYRTWPECAEQIQGFSGAEYKGFANLENAKEYMNENIEDSESEELSTDTSIEDLKKFYAVRIGRKPGIYRTWTECAEQVQGFSGAEYKGFGDVISAREYFLYKEEESF